MAERRDLVTLGRVQTSWQELPSPERINLRAVELAYIALQHSKLFWRTMTSRGVSSDDFLTGVRSLDVLTDRIEVLFAGTLSDKGREKLGRSILKHVVEHDPQPSNLNGDAFNVKEYLRAWVRRDFGLDKNSSKE